MTPRASALEPSKINLFLLLCGLAAAILYLIFYMASYHHWFVHPHSGDIQLPALMPDGLGFQWSDVWKAFAPVDSAEHRSRFLAYFITLMDYRIRLIAYEHFVLFAPFSVSWIITLGLCPYLLFRTARNLGLGIEAALAALILYLTSTGFISGFTMVLLSAKPLSNAVFIGCLYLMSRLKLSRRENQLLYEIKSPLKIAVLTLMLSGLFLDEMPLFAFALLPVVFRELFILPSLKPVDLRKMAVNALYFLLPLILFLAIIVWVVPIITETHWGYRFDYLGTVLATRPEEISNGKTLLGGRLEGFGWHSFFENITTLLGVSLVPARLSGFITHDSSGGVFSGQAHSAAQAFLELAALTVAGFWMFRASGENKHTLRRLGAVCVLYALFVSALIGRHVVYVTGYYYGCAFGLFFALTAGFCFEGVNRVKSWGRFLSTGLLILIAMTQLNNFSILNASHIQIHNEWTKKIYRRTFPIDSSKTVTREELRNIRSAWKENKLGDYLAQNPVSEGAVYLLAELKHRDASLNLERLRRTP